MRAEVLLWLALISVASCGETHGMLAADGGERGSREAGAAPDAGMSVVDAAAADAGARTAGSGSPRPAAVGLPTKIVVENVGRDAIVLEPNCGAKWWKLYRNGEELDVTSYCTTPCDRSLPQGCPAICRQTTKLLVSGATKTFEWDGTIVVGSVCQEFLALEKSTELVAKVCWDTALPWSAAPECASASFKYGDAQVVVEAKKEERAPRTTKLVLTNTGDQAVEITAEVCGGQAVFETDRAAQASLGLGCQCFCESATPDGICSPHECGTCAADVVKQLNAGESFEYVWDQRLFSRLHGLACWSSYTLAPEDMVTIRGCWRAAGGGKEECATRVVKGFDARVDFDTGGVQIDAGL